MMMFVVLEKPCRFNRPWVQLFHSLELKSKATSRQLPFSEAPMVQVCIEKSNREEINRIWSKTILWVQDLGTG